MILQPFALQEKPMTQPVKLSTKNLALFTANNEYLIPARVVKSYSQGSNDGGKAIMLTV